MAQEKLAGRKIYWQCGNPHWSTQNNNFMTRMELERGNKITVSTAVSFYHHIILVGGYSMPAPVFCKLLNLAPTLYLDFLKEHWQVKLVPRTGCKLEFSSHVPHLRCWGHTSAGLWHVYGYGDSKEKTGKVTIWFNVDGDQYMASYQGPRIGFYGQVPKEFYTGIYQEPEDSGSFLKFLISLGVAENRLEKVWPYSSVTPPEEEEEWEPDPQIEQHFQDAADWYDFCQSLED